eukprot:CAMPEP_0174308622 /NCGR_PEP_ID=MMETSP0810-20121108/1875_1 /TAXON_ID=73025 ORGANISM="Eutreptiella gymnastica-like, Strain CCMP1594" /NCGR_SAMPLE_ID=MMETSP0810 /ASSEMBLY_ACC=CAM_ASM_000659 /LENGTH=72 /DNA_ID=CAMNT_0015416001 /DNA_START=1809 /DNA_END=2027 /DNA_ORIENTATION=+
MCVTQRTRLQYRGGMSTLPDLSEPLEAPNRGPLSENGTTSFDYGSKGVVDFCHSFLSGSLSMQETMEDGQRW